MKLNIAVIGCGYWGKNLVRNFSELNVLSAICEDNPETAAELSRQFKVAVKDFASILSDETITAVAIATPAVTHVDIVTQALKAGKHVFVEKPLALNVKDGQQLCALAKQSQRILMVGHLLQYHSGFLQLLEMVKKGTLGKIEYIYSHRLSLGKFRNEENVLWSFAPHDISMILALTNQLPYEVTAMGGDYLQPNIADMVTVNLLFEQGVRAHILTSWLHPNKEQKLVVVGGQGMAIFNDGLPWEEKLQFYPHQIHWKNNLPIPEKAEVQFIELTQNEPLKAECQHFLEAIEHNFIPRTDGEEGLRVLTVLQAAEQSLKAHSVDAKIDYFKHESALVDEGCQIGQGSKIWHYSHILSGTQLGKHVIVGQNVMIGPDVIVGDRCKIQNNVSLYKGVILEEGVFCGPSCVFTNVFNPRAEIERKDEFRSTYVERGVTIGANATIVCGVRLGAYSFIGAGTVVIRDVKPHALMVGNPARQIGWVSHAGEKLDDQLICPREGKRYQIIEEQLYEIL